MMISAYLMVLWIALGWVGENASVNLLSVVLETVSLATLSVLLVMADGRGRALMILFGVTTFLYVDVRVLSLLAAPDSYKFLPKISMNVRELNWTLTYAILGSAALGAGILCSRRHEREEAEQASVSRDLLEGLSPTIAGLLFLLIMIIQLYEYWKLGVGRFALFRGEGLGYSGLAPSLWSTLFIQTIGSSADVALFVYFILALEKRRWDGGINRVLMSVVLLSYFVYRILTGSKGGLYYPVVFWLSYRLASGGDFRVRTKRFVAAALLLAALAPFVFYAGNLARLVLYYGPARRQLDLEDVRLVEEGAEAHEFEFFKQFVGVTRRLSTLDTLILIVNEKKADFGSYITWERVFEATRDFFIPSKFLSRPKVIPTSRFFMVVYLDATRWQIEEIYNTPIFSIWGLAYVFGGPWGGIIGMFIFGFVAGVLYNGAFYRGGRYNILLRTYVVYQFHLIMISMGMEDSILLLADVAAKGILVLMIIYAIGKIAHGWPLRSGRVSLNPKRNQMGCQNATTAD